MANKSINIIADLLKDMDAKIEHIEDINADSREVIIKLVKQSNQIVEFLRTLQVELVEEYDYPTEKLPSFDKFSGEKIREIKEWNEVRREKLLLLMDEFSLKNKELVELEKELSKHKDDLTPGIIGEA